MIDTAVRHIKAQGGRGLHLGIDSRNAKARAFYLHVGFERCSTATGEYFTLGFDKWSSGKIV